MFYIVNFYSIFKSQPQRYKKSSINEHPRGCLCLFYMKLQSNPQPGSQPANSTQPAFSRPSAAGFVKGNLFIFIATLFFGINIPVVKFLIPSWLSAMDVTVFRIMGACVLMWLASAFMHTDRIDRHDWLRVVLGGVVGLFSFITIFNLSLRYGDPIDISIIMTLPPLFIFLYNRLFRHVHSGAMEYIGVALGLAGAFIVIVMQSDMHGGGSNRLLGDLLAVASALCYSFYLVVLEGPARKYRPVSLLRWVFLFAAIPTLFLMPGLTHAPLLHPAAPTAEAWGMLTFVIVCPSFLAYFLLSPATRLIGSDLVSIYQYLVPVIATIGSVVLHLATLRTVQIIAMVVIIVGMALSEAGKRRRTRADASANQSLSKNND